VAAAREGIDPELVVERENARRARENELEKKLRDEIGAVVGPKNVRLVASVELDWTAEKTSERMLLPDESGRGFKISEQHETEDYKGPGPQAGVPGVEPNVPPPPEGAPPTYPVTETGAIAYSRTQDTINQDYGERLTEKTPQAPRIARQSVGIFLNEGEVAAAEGARIEQAAIVAAGIDRPRGDMLVVQRVPFAEEALPKVVPTWWQRWGRWLVPAIVTLFGIIVPLVMSWMAAPPPPAPPPIELGEEPEAEEGGLLAEETVPLETVGWEHILEEREVLDEAAEARAEIQRRANEVFEAVKAVAADRPQDFATALRAWLLDD
jgi:flagellar biosynthesis/type III secretory pathway M-ring protein FliF/YscJ